MTIHMTPTAMSPLPFARLRALSIVLLLLFVLGGCASIQKDGAQITTAASAPSDTRTVLSNSEAIKRALRAQLEVWRGTPYEYGGLSREGVDCSGFVYLTYQSRFGITLPRTTAGQSEVGHRVSKGELRPGDLVFFLIGDGRHVGIYLDDRRFMHASSSQGVTVSTLTNPYWKAHYWKAVRVLP